MSKKEPKEKRIEDIINAAVTEFLEKGYEGATIDGVAKRAGVSKGGFYHHFPNKEVLLMEANSKLSEPVMAMMEKAYSNPSPTWGLKEYIEEYLSYWGSHPKELSFFFLSMSKALEYETLMDYYKEYINASTDFFVGMFKRIEALNNENTSDAESLGISLMGALDGVLSYIIVHKGDIKAMSEGLEKIFIK